MNQGDEVANITTAHIAHSEDMRARMVKYGIAMAIRLVCLGLLFVVPGWWKVAPILGAVFIPWFAVIFANGGGDTISPDENALLDHAPQAELPVAEAPAAEPEPVLLQGEIVPEPDDEAPLPRPDAAP